MRKTRWWIANAAKLEGRQDVDLNTDPPPNLALEIEVSRRVGERWMIYAALRVPEVWSWDGETNHFYLLRGKKYHVAPRSRAFPFLSSRDLTPFANRMRDGDETGGMLAFQDWLKGSLILSPRHGARGGRCGSRKSLPVRQ